MEDENLDLIEEKKKLLQWFENYDKQIMQLNRCQRLLIDFDKDITELDNQAIEKQLRLREINNELKQKQVEEDEQNL